MPLNGLIFIKAGKTLYFLNQRRKFFTIPAYNLQDYFYGVVDEDRLLFFDSVFRPIKIVGLA